MAINASLSTLIVDKVKRIVMRDKATGKVLWTVSQIESPTINATLETDDIVDAMGTPIAKLDKAKTMTFSAQNSLFDIGLLAAQVGSDKTVSDATTTFNVPCFEEITINATTTSGTLSHTPIGIGAAAIPAIYLLDGARNIVEKYDYAATASATEFTFSGTTIDPPTGVVGDFLIIYDYLADAADTAIEVINSAVNFPRAGSALVEVLFCDTCNTDVKYYGFIEMPNAKLDGNFDLNFARDGKHPLTLMAMQEYCDKQKLLFRLIVPEAA